MEDKIIVSILYQGYEMISNRLHKKNTLILLVILYHGLGQHKKAKTKNRYCAISKCFMYLEV